MSQIDWQAIRALFPAVERYTYLNTASGGVMSAYAAEAAKRYYDEAHTQADVLWDAWLDRAEQVREQTARFLNAAPDEIAFLPNASLGLNLAAHLFDGEGGVLTTEDEFPSDTLPWLQRGYPVRFIPTAADGSVLVETIAEAIDPESRFLVTSTVQYRTGFRIDLAALGRLCRSRGLTFIVDATQGIGVFPIDVQQQQIDVLVFSGYKWATAGYGIAVLYIRKEHLAGRALPMAGWRSARDPYVLRNDQLDLAAHTTALELGHPLFPGIFALGGALRHPAIGNALPARCSLAAINGPPPAMASPCCISVKNISPAGRCRWRDGAARATPTSYATINSTSPPTPQHSNSAIRFFPASSPSAARCTSSTRSVTTA